MNIRGAPAIGVAGAFGMYLAALEIKSHTNIREHLKNAAVYLISCRPTAINLAWAVNKVLERLSEKTQQKSVAETALSAAKEICESEVDNCKKIGLNGLSSD